MNYGDPVDPGTIVSVPINIGWNYLEKRRPILETFTPAPPHFLCKLAEPRKVTTANIIVPAAGQGGKQRGNRQNQQMQGPEMIIVTAPDRWPKEAAEAWGDYGGNPPYKKGDRVLAMGVNGPHMINSEPHFIVHAQDILGKIDGWEKPPVVKPIG